MNYFFSGSTALTRDLEQELAYIIKHRLCSCHAAYYKEALRWAEIINEADGHVEEYMLDSGAFTAWTKGHEVTLDDLSYKYEQVLNILNTESCQPWLINLDVIPGSFGIDPTPEMINDAIKQSDINFKLLTERFGNIVIPVYHQGEDKTRKLEVCDMGEYVCFSPRNDLPEWSRVRWSQEVHVGVKNRTHGLATTGEKMMRVPWHSVDSATWTISAGLGQVIVNLNGRLKSVSISQESPGRRTLDHHFDTLPDTMQEAISSCISSLGYTFEEAREKHTVRRMLTAKAIAAYMDQHVVKKTTVQQGLFQ